MKNINTYTLNLFENKKIFKWVRLSLILFALSSYFIAALSFQLLAHDKISSSLLIITSVLGFIGSTMLMIGLFIYNFIKEKYGEKIAVLFIYLAALGLVFALIALIIGPIGYLQFR